MDNAVQENLVCLFGRKDGFFANFVQRVGLVSGSGVSLQAGGNLSPDYQQYGISLTKLFCGSHYNLGCLYEVVLESNRDANCYLVIKKVKDISEGIDSLLAETKADGVVLMQTNQGTV